MCPCRIRIRVKDWRALLPDRYPIEKESISVEFEPGHESDSRFTLPPWVGNPENPAWKYQLGQILRVLLTGRPDFTISAPLSNGHHSIVRYAPYTSSWLRRRYGLFNGRSAFGPPWLPISSWLGSLLSRLLEWPGFARYEFDFRLADGFDLASLADLLDERISVLENVYGRASCTPLLPFRVPKAFMRPSSSTGSKGPALFSMRVGVVQTVIPRQGDFTCDPELRSTRIRQSHRRHVSAVLGAVHRMLQVRETHCSEGSGIELLVFPELSIHPDDIWTHVVPFVRQHRCIVCAGIVFHKAGPGMQLVNSAYWIIPLQTPYGGLTVQQIEQGKWNLTTDEVNLGIQRFRPAQWILEIVNPRDLTSLWSMTGAICYDSTDLCLAADLRNVTDMFVVPALNTDVGTFDNMAAALHYHMFQHVIVSNSGQYGGSTAQAPFDNRHKRTIFHAHGNEQVSVSFFEVDLNTYRGGTLSLKTPPAGYTRR